MYRYALAWPNAEAPRSPCPARAGSCGLRRGWQLVGTTERVAPPSHAHEEGAAALRYQLSHDQGRLRDHGAPNVGAARGRPPLQPGEESLLRRAEVLPRRSELRDAVRHQPVP